MKPNTAKALRELIEATNNLELNAAINTIEDNNYVRFEIRPLRETGIAGRQYTTDSPGLQCPYRDYQSTIASEQTVE